MSDVAEQFMSDDHCEDGTCVETAETTNSPPWGSIKKNKENFPNKSQFIIQRGDKRSEWKLPYKLKNGKIHCGGVAAASQAAGGARQKKPMSLNSTERARLNRARKACKTGEPKTSDEMLINLSMGKLLKVEMVEEGEDEGGKFQTHKYELMDNANTYNGLHFPGEAIQHQNDEFQNKDYTVSHGKNHSHLLEDQLGEVMGMELVEEGNDIFRCFITSKFYYETGAQLEARVLMRQGLCNYISGGWSARIIFNEEEGRFEISKPVLREVSSTPVPAKTDASIQDVMNTLRTQIQNPTNVNAEEQEIEDIPMEELEMKEKNPKPEEPVEQEVEEPVEQEVEKPSPTEGAGEQSAEFTALEKKFEDHIAKDNLQVRASLLEKAAKLGLPEADFEGQPNESITFALEVANKVQMSTLREINPDTPLGTDGQPQEMTEREVIDTYYDYDLE